MELKQYQQKVVERLDEYLATLRGEYEKSAKVTKALVDAGVDVPDGLDDYPKNAWAELKKKGLLPRFKSNHGLIAPDYVARYDRLKRSIPHICLKVPTGGGKTLLASEGLGHIQTSFLRRQTGLVLWVVPTVQIYRQTWNALANREHPYRQILERASGGRVKIMEKDDALNKADVDNYLCIMLVRLAATNRANNNDFLKIFRDAGKYTSFFPEVDDYTANNNLLALFPDLETHDFADAGAYVGVSVKQSLVNVLKMLRPLVIIDEGHKAYSDNTRDSLNNFNPSFIVELTATPNAKHHISNVLVDVSGLDLKTEQMIKLPINIINTAKGDWGNTLTQAMARLNELQASADHLQESDGRYIRPIMVIRVERTGKDQRGTGKIHADDAKEFLMQQLGVPEGQIKIKSSSNDQLGDLDLLSPLCPVRFIITKEALQEGWDCPFAYVLVLLDKTTASTAMTQMVGRILRQPNTETTSVAALNECYVHCFDQNVKEAVDNVRKGLEDEGMTGLGDFVRNSGGSSADDVPLVETTIKRQKKFQGLQIFLPQVLYKDGKNWRNLNYDRDILADVPWDSLTYATELFMDGKDAPSVTTTTVDVAKGNLLLGQLELNLVVNTTRQDSWIEKRLDLSFISRQLMDVMPNPWQASRMVMETVAKLKSTGNTDDALFDNRIFLAESMKRDIKNKLNDISEQIFCQKLKDGTISFRLTTSGDKQLNYEIAQELKVLANKDEQKLVKRDNTLPENTLFECVFEHDLNELEKDFALYLSDDQAVSWWHRMVSRQEYALQGWQRNKIYPDFVACVNGNKILVLETKGLQLKGNDDTSYKQKLMDLLSACQQDVFKAGEINITNGNNQSVRLAMLMQDDWQEKYSEIKMTI